MRACEINVQDETRGINRRYGRGGMLDVLCGDLAIP